MTPATAPKWRARLVMGVLTVAGLSLGHVITDAWPTNATDERSFVRHAKLGATAQLRWADVKADSVESAHFLALSTGKITTPGRFLVVTVVVTARGERLGSPPPAFTLVGGNGRTYETDGGRGLTWTTAPTGIAWYTQVPFEVPREALAGARLQAARDALDSRRDDVADIDLGITQDAVAGLWNTEATIKITDASWSAS